jgi:hypothetical protein
MAILGLYILARRVFPCFGLSQKRKSRKSVNERSPLLRANNNINTYLTVSNRSDDASSSTSPAKPNDSSRPRILSVRLTADKTLTQALTLNPELLDLLLNAVLTRRELRIYEEQGQTHKFAIAKRANEFASQSRCLSSKLRGSPSSPRHKSMIYSLQYAIKVLEEERETLIQKRKETDQDMALRREQLCLGQAKIDAINDLASTTASLLPPAHQHEFDHPTLQELDLELSVLGENQLPLQKIIDDRRKYFETAKERLAS